MICINGIGVCPLIIIIIAALPVIKEQAYLTPKPWSSYQRRTALWNAHVYKPTIHNPSPLNYDGWIRFFFIVQPKFMKRLYRSHKRRSLCAWKGTKKSSREVRLFLSLSVHNSDATFLHWGHQPPLVVPLYSWLHVPCATFWCISGFPGPPYRQHLLWR